MFSQAPRPFEPTSEYPERTWSRPLCNILQATTRDVIQDAINAYLSTTSWHIVGLSDVTYTHVGGVMSYLVTVVYQVQRDSHVQ